MKEVWLWLVLLTAEVVAQESQQGLLRGMMSQLQHFPVIGNVLRASVHPIYRPIVNQFQPEMSDREGDGGTLDLCFGEIGCIYNDNDFFHPIHRPLNLPPNSREEIHVLFTLVTREEATGRVIEALDITGIVNSTFSSERKTKILIHGFLDSNGVTWMLDMMRALLLYDNLNVIMVDWSGGSRALYSQATANTRVVGLEVAHLVNWLKDNADLQPKDVHIIGHSLGAHTAGYAGERITGLGRITGLDPAEPYFQHMPPTVRLDPTDADFVDVIHTDVDSIIYIAQTVGLGLLQPVGHIDFYPNDGRKQPGCRSFYHVPLTALTDGLDLFEGLDSAQKEIVACNHNRAPKLFTDSIHSTCPYRAFQCDSYDQYMEGKCLTCGEDGTRCAPMGYHADTWAGVEKKQSHASFYLSTTSGPNYCIYHYKLIVELGDPDEVAGSLRGNLKVSFFTDEGNIRDFDLTPESPGTFARGKSYSFLLEYAEDLTSSRDALVHWTYEADVFNPLSYCVLFCDTSLPLARITFNSVDMTYSVSRKPTQRPGENTGSIHMCHKKGEKIIRINSEESVRIVSSPLCEDITGATQPFDVRNDTMELLNAGIDVLTSYLNI